MKQLPSEILDEELTQTLTENFSQFTNNTLEISDDEEWIIQRFEDDVANPSWASANEMAIHDIVTVTIKPPLQPGAGMILDERPMTLGAVAEMEEIKHLQNQIDAAEVEGRNAERTHRRRERVKWVVNSVGKVVKAVAAIYEPTPLAILFTGLLVPVAGPAAPFLGPLLAKLVGYLINKFVRTVGASLYSKFKKTATYQNVAATAGNIEQAVTAKKVALHKRWTKVTDKVSVWSGHAKSYLKSTDLTARVTTHLGENTTARLHKGVSLATEFAVLLKQETWSQVVDICFETDDEETMEETDAEVPEDEVAGENAIAFIENRVEETAGSVVGEDAVDAFQDLIGGGDDDQHEGDDDQDEGDDDQHEGDDDDQDEGDDDQDEGEDDDDDEDNDDDNKPDALPNGWKHSIKSWHQNGEVYQYEFFQKGTDKYFFDMQRAEVYVVENGGEILSWYQNDSQLAGTYQPESPIAEVDDDQYLHLRQEYLRHRRVQNGQFQNINLITGYVSYPYETLSEGWIKEFVTEHKYERWHHPRKQNTYFFDVIGWQFYGNLNLDGTIWFSPESREQVHYEPQNTRYMADYPQHMRCRFVQGGQFQKFNLVSGYVSAPLPLPGDARKCSDMIDTAPPAQLPAKMLTVVPPPKLPAPPIETAPIDSQSDKDTDEGSSGPGTPERLSESSDTNSDIGTTKRKNVSKARTKVFKWEWFDLKDRTSTLIKVDELAGSLDRNSVIVKISEGDRIKVTEHYPGTTCDHLVRVPKADLEKPKPQWAFTWDRTTSRQTVTRKESSGDLVNVEVEEGYFLQVAIHYKTPLSWTKKGPFYTGDVPKDDLEELSMNDKEMVFKSDDLKHVKPEVLHDIDNLNDDDLVWLKIRKEDVGKVEKVYQVDRAVRVPTDHLQDLKPRWVFEWDHTPILAIVDVLEENGSDVTVKVYGEDISRVKTHYRDHVQWTENIKRGFYTGTVSKGDLYDLTIPNAKNTRVVESQTPTANDKKPSRVGKLGKKIAFRGLSHRSHHGTAAQAQAKARPTAQRQRKELFLANQTNNCYL